jgi:hypothetical protein
MIRGNVVTQGLGVAANLVRSGYARPVVGSAVLTIGHPAIVVGAASAGLQFRGHAVLVASHPVLAAPSQTFSLPVYHGTSALVIKHPVVRFTATVRHGIITVNFDNYVVVGRKIDSYLTPRRRTDNYVVSYWRTDNIIVVTSRG